MPVKFYPPKPIENLEKYIFNNDNGKPLLGEIDIYKKIYSDLSNSEISWYVWHDLKLPLHSKFTNDLNKKSGQIDFLVICKYGIIILEVKGGKISYRENFFFHGNFEKKLPQDPFRQVEGYKFTLKDLILNNFKKTIFCDAVAFPHVENKFNAHLIEDEKLWTSFNANHKYNNNIENFFLNLIEHHKNKYSDKYISFNDLDERDIENILKILSPIITDSNPYNKTTQNTLEWLQIQNLDILKSLSKNNKIMLEGPPGSGKTTLAKAFIDNQINKKGLYLCWNNFLKCKVNYELKKHFKDERCEVYTLFSFLINNSKYSYNDLINLNPHEFEKIVRKVITDININYDYLIIDEAQDIFDKGFEYIINRLLSNGNGLKNGTALILYDIDQSYVYNNPEVYELADLYIDYFSHFKLDEIKRSAQNPVLKQLATKVIEGEYEVLEEKYENINIERIDSLKALKKSILRNCLSFIRNNDSSLYGKDCVVLIDSDIYNNGYKNEYINQELGEINDVELLNENNLNNDKNILKYTSILKYKGLESHNVFLVISKPNDINKYEIYLGITRAISNLTIYILD